MQYIWAGTIADFLRDGQCEGALHAKAPLWAEHLGLLRAQLGQVEASVRKGGGIAFGVELFGGCLLYTSSGPCPFSRRRCPVAS